jgi:hypothetical protein
MMRLMRSRLEQRGNCGEEAEGHVATNAVYHDAAHQSHLLLPLLNHPPT